MKRLITVIIACIFKCKVNLTSTFMTQNYDIWRIYSRYECFSKQEFDNNSNGMLINTTFIPWLFTSLSNRKCFLAYLFLLLTSSSTPPLPLCFQCGLGCPPTVIKTDALKYMSDSFNLYILQNHCSRTTLLWTHHKLILFSIDGL